MNYTESNKEIAEFMGAEQENWSKTESRPHYAYPAGEYPEHQKYWDASLLKYHTSWDDWLMSVVERIESDEAVTVNISRHCFINRKTSKIGTHTIASCKGETKI